MDNDKIVLKRANFTDAEDLVKVCKRSYDKEMILMKDGKPGGPEGYDGLRWYI